LKIEVLWGFMSILMKKYKENKITVHLAEEYLGEHLISRSIARRILSNIEKFKFNFKVNKKLDRKKFNKYKKS